MAIMNIVYGLVGIVGGWFVHHFWMRRMPAAAKIIGAISRKNKLVFLETHNGTYFREVVKQFGTLGVTSDKELLIIPPDSTKPCLNLGGLQVGHGDFYRTILVPSELMKYKDELKAKGMREEDIAQFIKDVQELPKDKLKTKLESEKLGTLDKIKNAVSKKDVAESKEETKYELYIMMPSLVSTFIYTGLNRVSIHEMLRNLVAQRELENLGARNWIAMAIFGLLLLVGGGLAIKWILPALAGYKTATASAAAAGAVASIGG